LSEVMNQPTAITSDAPSRDRRITRRFRSSPRILLADDYVSLLTAVKRLLEQSGYDVMAMARTGAQAIEVAARLRPDVAVVDVRLPDLDGLEVCRHLAAVAPDTRVVLCTAADDPDIKRRAFELGACGFVLKYRTGSDLVSAIERALLTRAKRRGAVSDHVNHSAGAGAETP